MVNLRHTVTVDTRHMIEVWSGEVGYYYAPYYSRTGRTWSGYRRHGQQVICNSLQAAKNVCRSR
jgi:hypothetical protein